MISSLFSLFVLVSYLSRDGELQKLQQLSPGAVESAVDRHFSTALHWSAGNGHLAVCKWLVQDRGSDVTAANRTGRTPLHLAARNGHLEVCRWLVHECSVPADVLAQHSVSALQVKLTDPDLQDSVRCPLLTAVHRLPGCATLAASYLAESSTCLSLAGRYMPGQHSRGERVR